MKNAPLLAVCLLASFAIGGAQTTPPGMQARPAYVHRKTPASQAPACPCALAPVLPAGVPPAPGKVETAFALRYIDVQPGTGDAVTPNEFLTVQYTGWLAADGTKFDSSLDRNEPFTFRQGVRQVIPGWDLGFAGMRVGGKRRLFIPYQLAYGEAGRPSIPPKSDLIFDIELVAASENPPGPPAPAPPPPPGSGTQPQR